MPPEAVPASLLTSMLTTISSSWTRYDSGVHIDTQAGLGHRRLSIIGLDHGHQPLSNEDGTIWITFNGEVLQLSRVALDTSCTWAPLCYRNRYRSNRSLVRRVWRSMSSRSSAVCSLSAFGTKKQAASTCKRSSWDKAALLPSWQQIAGLRVELKALLADPDIRPDIDPAMIQRFLTCFYLPGEETLLCNIRKLPPGSW